MQVNGRINTTAKYCDKIHTFKIYILLHKIYLGENVHFIKTVIFVLIDRSIDRSKQLDQAADHLARGLIVRLLSLLATNFLKI